jgi:hypothetical protein
MDLNLLTHDADDLIRKVVARYNQLYVPAGNISQVELDLMLDDLRKLYDTFKKIGQANLTLQQQDSTINLQASPFQNKAEAKEVNQQESEKQTFTEEIPVQKVVTTEPSKEEIPETENPVEDLEKVTEEHIFEDLETQVNEELHDESSNAVPLSEETIQKQEEAKPDVISKSEHAPSTLAEKFNAGNKSLSETMADASKEVMGGRKLFQPITDLSTGIGLNDRFNFINELFANNSESYYEAIGRINKAVNVDEATWILLKYQTPLWDQKQEALVRLKDFIKRRFI